MARSLQRQFSGVLVSAEEHCSVCFNLKPTDRTIRIPRGLGMPLAYDATGATPDAQFVQVLLWHKSGFIDSVEISRVGDEHPELGDLVFEAH